MDRFAQYAFALVGGAAAGAALDTGEIAPAVLAAVCGLLAALCVASEIAVRGRRPRATRPALLLGPWGNGDAPAATIH